MVGMNYQDKQTNMNYTATIIKTEKDQYGSYVVTVEFKHNTTNVIYTKLFVGVTEELELKKQIQDTIAYYEKLDNAQISQGVVDLTNINPVISKEEQDKNDFNNLIDKLERMKRFVNLGIIDITDPYYADILNKAKTKFKIEYI